MAQRYKIVMNTLMREIFQHKLQPGAKLPTERELSKKMDVDRTSLRVALKQLESMEVLEIRQGDGIYVKNYMKSAGVDFLRLLFLQQEEDDNEVIIDEFIIDEVFEFYLEYMPLMVKVALRRFTPRDAKMMIDILDAELKDIKDRQKVIESELRQQELVAERTDNLLFLLLSNSTRPLRKKFVELFIDRMDDERLTAHIEFKKAMVRTSLLGNPKNPDIQAEHYREFLLSYRDVIKKSWYDSVDAQKTINELLKSRSTKQG